MSRQRQSPSTHSSPDETAATEPAEPTEVAAEIVGPDISDARQLSQFINAAMNRSLRDLLGTLIPQTGPDARACVATKGTVQHVAGPDTVYVLDYELHIDYRCITPTSSTEGTTN